MGVQLHTRISETLLSASEVEASQSSPRGWVVEISTINRELQALRRMFHLAQEWGKVERALPTARMVPGGETPGARPYVRGGGAVQTDNARRRIPMTPRVKAILEMRFSKSEGGEWIFPARTRSGHVEPSSLKK